ncbi:MAG: dockerin type I domain-containing protein [Oscillospiraceae bacterium]|nr:dockerin type I domain-containing protein [Oscillospiraceae bacterium]MDY3257895.1 dockerin type I domain-containing protein [Ruminococcus callidus]
MKLKKIISAAVGATMLCASLPISGAEVGFTEGTLKVNAADEVTTWVATDEGRSWEETTEKRETATEDKSLGDVNADGRIDSKDSVIVLKAYAETLAGAVGVLKQEEAFRADVNGDNRYDTKDAVIILKKYAERLISDGSNNISDDSAKTSITMESVFNFENNTVDIPVKISGNEGFAGGGIVFNYDSKLSFVEIKNGIVGILVKHVGNNSVAITFASSENVAGDGVMFILQFKLPDDATQGGAFEIDGSIDTFCDSDTKDVSVKIVNGVVNVASNTTTTTKTDTTTTSAKSLGDLNGDKNIDSKDAVIVLKSYAEILVNGNTTNDISAGDVNEDGNVDSKDAVLILKYYAATLTGFTGDISEFNK